MMLQSSRLRGVFVGAVALAMSAGAVFAGQALPTANRGLDRASEEVDFDLPARTVAEDPAGGGDSDEEQVPKVEDGEAEVDPAVPAPVDAESAWDNHGALVSTAATMEAPDGFRNHGHFVSCVAHMKDLATAPADLSGLTPEDCEAAVDADEGELDAEEPAPEEVDEAAWDSHGALVSTAARSETPEGFRNHGHFVACVAHIEDLAAAPTDMTGLTPEDCEPAEVETDDAEPAVTGTEDEADAGQGVKDKTKDPAKVRGGGQTKERGAGNGRGKGRHK